MDPHPTEPDADDSPDIDLPGESAAALARIVEKFGGQVRPGQQQMVDAVAKAFANDRSVTVEAPTGTGKSLSYLIPIAVNSGGKPVVVATATKALQQQLIDKDLPLLASHFPGLSYAVMKGRSNYACHDKVAQVTDPSGQEALFEDRVDQDVLEELLGWVDETDTGDRNDAPDGVTDAEWNAISVGPNECLKAENCRFGDTCFAEAAKRKAQNADVVVTNTHMLLLNFAAFGNLLPTHDHVVIDEAHKLPSVAGGVFGAHLGGGRMKWLASAAKSFASEDALDKMQRAATRFISTLDSMAHIDGRVDPTTGDLAAALDQADAATRTLAGSVAESSTTDENEASRKEQLSNGLKNLIDELAGVRTAGNTEVCWIEGGSGRRAPSLRMVPVDVAPVLAENLFANYTVVMTSATMTVGRRFDYYNGQVGLPPTTDSLIVPSPFDFAKQGLLYVPRDEVPPGFQTKDEWERRSRELTLELLEASGGRALLLFTSWSRLREMSDWLDEQDLPFQLMRQGDAPPGRLVENFKADETSVLAGTHSFWEGVDIPGKALSLVIIDKLPFPSPKDPLLSAQRDLIEQRGGHGWSSVDLPVSAMMLAQGAGRLIRTTTDTGVVAVLDSRLGTKSYRETLLATMPPLRRTIDLAGDVAPFLRDQLDTEPLTLLSG